MKNNIFVLQWNFIIRSLNYPFSIKLCLIIIFSFFLQDSFANTVGKSKKNENLQISNEVFVNLEKKMDIGPVKDSSKEKRITGKVLDEETQEPLVGASVMLVGAKLGAVTDIDGHFEIIVPEDLSIVLRISYVGYQTIEQKVKGTFATVYLSEDSQSLEEVQVVAYGTQKKPTITGAISSIDTKGLLKSPSGSVANALSGAVSGVSSVQISGQPGAEDPDIFVRGTGSLSVETSRPLILVDGVERSFFQMDPNEIENITVLKDASSTAVFGVRGANGVILVTTRRGNKGKPSISLSSSAGLTQSLRNLDMVDSYTHALLYTEAQRNDNPSLSPSKQIFTPFIIQKFKDKSDPIIFPSIDWNDYLFRKVSWQTQHNLTLSGGGDRFRYFVSLGYLHQDDIVL
jgi:TonB-linked SusC/RagA family outer membrane protein